MQRAESWRLRVCAYSWRCVAHSSFEVANSSAAAGGGSARSRVCLYRLDRELVSLPMSRRWVTSAHLDRSGHESSSLLWRDGHAASRLLRAHPKAARRGRVETDPVAPDEVLRSLRTQRIHLVSRSR